MAMNLAAAVLLYACVSPSEQGLLSTTLYKCPEPASPPFASSIIPEDPPQVAVNPLRAAKPKTAQPQVSKKTVQQPVEKPTGQTVEKTEPPAETEAQVNPAASSLDEEPKSKAPKAEPKPKARVKQAVKSKPQAQARDAAIPDWVAQK